MKPYKKDELEKRHKMNDGEYFTPKFKKKLKTESRRGKRNMDKKSLREEWEF
jgi:hypothetical protein